MVLMIWLVIVTALPMTPPPVGDELTVIICTDRSASVQHYRAVTAATNNAELTTSMDGLVADDRCSIEVIDLRGGAFTLCKTKVDDKQCAGLRARFNGEPRYLSILPNGLE